MALKTLTLRLPEDVYEDVQARKSSSITGYIVEAVEEKLKRDQDEELAKGFQALVDEEHEETEIWQHAQREAMKHAQG